MNDQTEVNDESCAEGQSLLNAGLGINLEMEMKTEKLEAAFLELAERDATAALQLITGMFVGLNLEFVRRQGEDANKEIKLMGFGNRNITIHAKDA
jgi:hypothetical protein